MRAVALLIAVTLGGCCATDTCTQRQTQAMGVILATGGFWPAPQRPVFVSCSGSGTMASCWSN